MSDESECHVRLIELESEFDEAEDRVSSWLHDKAAFSDCAAKLDGVAFCRLPRNHKKPANDNGRSS